MKKYFNDRGFRILAALDEVAKVEETSLAAVAIAWLIAKPSVTAPIASATSLRQMDHLIRGAELQLSPVSIEKLDKASAY